MEKTIISEIGSIIVETDGSLWGLMAGDVITCDIPSVWRNKRVIIEGFENIQGGTVLLWGTVEGMEKSKMSFTADGLILLKRQGLEFEVGDDVFATSGEAKEKEGKIIVIDPYKYIEANFLVEFKNFINGHNCKNSWKEPWYPNCYETDPNNNRLWIFGNSLKFLSEK